jgi:RNase H-fold protein (predicted Holliday junction resolvase)
LILAIDPGTAKIGFAVTDQSGRSAKQGILPYQDWERRLAELASLGQIRIVVIGDGTNRVNIEQGLSRLLPQVPIVAVDEKGSTVDAWRLKRETEAGTSPFKQFVFTLRQLFSPVPVDDYAALVLALRFVQGGGAIPDGPAA